MQKIIPLHSLVIIAARGAGDGVRVAEVEAMFPAHEIIRAESVSRDLAGPGPRPELAAIIQSEIKHRIALKLSLGERAVVHDSHRRGDWRNGLARLAERQGAPVIRLLTEPGHDCPDAGTTAIAFGRDTIAVVTPLPDNPLEHISNGFRGITVIGDVHGNLPALKSAVAWATGRNQFVWFLGDVIDYGNEPLAAFDLVHGMVMGGTAAMVIGNHERKIARWAQHHEDGDRRAFRLSEGNQVTAAALNALDAGARQAWLGRFRAVLGRVSLLVRMGNVSLVHGAMHPDVWSGRDNPRDIENYALYGEPDMRPGTAFRQGHSWVDSVPPGETVFVGHDVRSTMAPIAVTGALGGKVVFLDTGSGKGGPLATADLRFAGKELRLENFNLF